MADAARTLPRACPSAHLPPRAPCARNLPPRWLARQPVSPPRATFPASAPSAAHGGRRSGQYHTSGRAPPPTPPHPPFHSPPPATQVTAAPPPPARDTARGTATQMAAPLAGRPAAAAGRWVGRDPHRRPPVEGAAERVRPVPSPPAGQRSRNGPGQRATRGAPGGPPTGSPLPPSSRFFPLPPHSSRVCGGGFVCRSGPLWSCLVPSPPPSHPKQPGPFTHGFGGWRASPPPRPRGTLDPPPTPRRRSDPLTRARRAAGPTPERGERTAWGGGTGRCALRARWCAGFSFRGGGGVGGEGDRPDRATAPPAAVPWGGGGRTRGSAGGRHPAPPLPFRPPAPRWLQAPCARAAATATATATPPPAGPSALAGVRGRRPGDAAGGAAARGGARPRACPGSPVVRATGASTPASRVPRGTAPLCPRRHERGPSALALSLPPFPSPTSPPSAPLRPLACPFPPSSPPSFVPLSPPLSPSPFPSSFCPSSHSLAPRAPSPRTILPRSLLPLVAACSTPSHPPPRSLSDALSHTRGDCGRAPRPHGAVGGWRARRGGRPPVAQRRRRGRRRRRRRRRGRRRRGARPAKRGI